MADLNPNPRGGLTTNRDSLHASAEYKRQCTVLKRMKESDMAEKMTLEQVRDWHRKMEALLASVGSLSAGAARHKASADAIDAHLAQPSQAVDVGAEKQNER